MTESGSPLPFAGSAGPTIRVDGSTVLRPLRPADAIPLYEAVDGNREHLAEWLDWVDGYSLDRSEQFIAGARERFERGTGLELALEVGGAIAGMCGFVDIVPAHREVEIGYWLGQPFTGRGLMTRAAVALTDYAVEVMGVHRVAIAVYGGNARSRAIPQRLGFRAEGVFAAARWHRDCWHTTWRGTECSRTSGGSAGRPRRRPRTDTRAAGRQRAGTDHRRSRGATVTANLSRAPHPRRRATLLPGRALPPRGLYLGTALMNGLMFTLALTTYGLYVVDAAHLTPLQLVLAGTGLEAAVFVSEVPTGVVADAYSRRLSIVIGLVVTAAGFALMGAVPNFASVLLGQIVWGVGYTFGSGAREAWLADEIGEREAATAYVRAAQVARVGRLAGIPLGTGLAAWHLQAPFLVGGALFLVYAGALALTMGERGYMPAGRQPGDPPWRTLAGTVRHTATSVRGHPVLVTILVIALLGGVSSEALDRLWPLHLVGRFAFPPFFGLGEVGWFGVIQTGSLIGGIAAVWIAGRLTALDDPRSLARTLFALAVLLIVAALGFALAGGFGVALAALWVTGWVRAAQEPLFLAWVNRGLDSRSRATVLSVFGQADALGQVAGGPVLGVLATVRSVRAALVAVGVVLVPSLPLYGWASRREPRTGAEPPA